MGLPVLTAVTGAEWESALVAGLDGGSTGSPSSAGASTSPTCSRPPPRAPRGPWCSPRTSGAWIKACSRTSPQRASPWWAWSTRTTRMSIGGYASSASSTCCPPTLLHRRSPTRSGSRWPRWPCAGAGPGARGAPRGRCRCSAHRPRISRVHRRRRRGGGVGPTGAPGRTTVVVGVADEAARLGVSTLLIDADTYGGVIGQVLGLLDESPGLAAAARPRQRRPARRSRARAARPRAQPDAARPHRDQPGRPLARAAGGRGRRGGRAGPGLAALTVVDCGFCLEQDEELAYDTAAPRRNGDPRGAGGRGRRAGGRVGHDPVGIQRLVRGLTALRMCFPTWRPACWSTGCARVSSPATPAGAGHRGAPTVRRRRARRDAPSRPRRARPGDVHRPNPGRRGGAGLGAAIRAPRARRPADRPAGAGRDPTAPALTGPCDGPSDRSGSSSADSQPCRSAPLPGRPAGGRPRQRHCAAPPWQAGRP